MNRQLKVRVRRVGRSWRVFVPGALSISSHPWKTWREAMDFANRKSTQQSRAGRMPWLKPRAGGYQPVGDRPKPPTPTGRGAAS